MFPDYFLIKMCPVAEREQMQDGGFRKLTLGQKEDASLGIHPLPAPLI